VKRFSSALLALATALAISPAALASSLCPNIADSQSDGTISTASGPCGAVTLAIANDSTDGAVLYWGPSSYGATGITVGNIASFNTSLTFTAGSFDEPYYQLYFIDPNGVFGEAIGDGIFMLEFQSGNLSGNNMPLDPNAALLNIFDANTGTYLLGGQADTETLAQWNALYPDLSDDRMWVGVGMGYGGSGDPATMTIYSADYSVTPEPSCLLLLGTGLLSMAVILFRKQKASGLTSHS